jgi:hypothetical protein
MADRCGLDARPADRCPLVLLDNHNTWINETGDVTGEIDTSNLLILSGTTHSTSGEQPGTTTLNDWRSQLAGDTNAQLVGDFILMQNFRNAFGDQQLKLTCQLEDVQRFGGR